MNSIWRCAALFASVIFSLSAFSVDIDLSKLQNDKEVLTASLSPGAVQRIKDAYSELYAQDLNFILVETLREYLDNSEAPDELEFAGYLEARFLESGLEPGRLQENLKVLRVFNFIDDIFYEILSRSMKLQRRLRKVDQGESWFQWRRYFFTPKILKSNDLVSLYEHVNKDIDENKPIGLKSFKTFAKKINTNWIVPRVKDLAILNQAALTQGLINEETYVRLMAMSEEGAASWQASLNAYLEIIDKAKNSMQYSEAEPVGADSDIFPSQYYDRVKKITRRKELYYRFSPTQIVMMAQVLEKVSVRMGVDPSVDTEAPYIRTDYVQRRNGEVVEYSEVYYLSPSEQFEFARKRLRLDIMNLKASKAFRGVDLSYEDIVMAAYETGYISNQDLRQVVDYDNLWNPNISPWKKYKDFVYSFAGQSALFLPAPWNILAAVGMTLLNGEILNPKPGHEDHENPANVFH